MFTKNIEGEIGKVNSLCQAWYVGLPTQARKGEGSRKRPYRSSHEIGFKDDQSKGFQRETSIKERKGMKNDRRKNHKQKKIEKIEPGGLPQIKQGLQDQGKRG